MEVRDLAQPKGLLAFWPEAPRPTKMVLPGSGSVRVVWNFVVKGELTSLHGYEGTVSYLRKRSVSHAHGIAETVVVGWSR